MNSQKNKSIAVKMMLFNLVAIAMVVLVIKRPLWSVIAAGFILLNIFIFKFVSAQKASSLEKYEGNMYPMSPEELKKPQKLLRYATAILAFLSFYTTTQGMKDFVFSAEWLAYLGSFAVQSILVVFSLLLCHFFVLINSNNVFRPEVRVLLKGVLTVFFSICLIVSSTFSYSYIANTAYKDSRISDYDTILQNFLFTESHKLQIENDLRGKILYDNISEKMNENLVSVIDDFAVEENNEFIKNIKRIEFADYQIKEFFPMDQSDQYSRQTKNDYDDLKRQYEAKKDNYKEYVNKYDTLKGEIITAIEVIDEDNLEECISLLKQKTEELELLKSSIEGLRDGMKDWKTSRLNNDISGPRSSVVEICNGFLKNIEYTVNEIDKYLPKDTDSGENNISDASTFKSKYEAIFNDIALLELETNPDTIKVTENLSSLLNEAGSQGVLSSANTAVLQDLKNQLIEYNRYLQLKMSMERYINEKLSITYKVESVSDNTSDVSNSNMVDNKIVRIEETEWLRRRNDDFYMFFTFLKSIPDIDALSTEFSNYDVDSVLYEAQVLRRDLLGDLTDFERSFDYFKYDFNVMAIFSAFIALFFDLGSFLTGVFLFAVSYCTQRNDTKTLNKQNEK